MLIFVGNYTICMRTTFFEIKLKMDGVHISDAKRDLILENFHSRSQISRIFENESSVWVRESFQGYSRKFSKFEVRMRATILKILKDSGIILENWP